MIANSPFTYTPSGGDWLRILPELIVLAAVFVTLLADLALPERRKSWLAAIGLIGVIGSAISLGYVNTLGGGTAFYGMIASGGVSLFASAIILFALGFGLLYSPGYVERQRIEREGEYYVLLQLAALGMMLMAAAGNLMVIFVGLETLSLALYVLSALPQTRLRAQESGMKYFILSSFASAFLLYGMSLTYGATGRTDLSDIAHYLGSHVTTLGQGFGPLLIVGIGLMVVGFSFKVSAVPFQSWTPDVYVGAPTPVTAFMSVGTKVAAFTALARVFVFALQAEGTRWQPVIWAIAALTMVVGNLLAVTQRNVKRMLAYSSVANAGYLLVAVATASPRALASLYFYLAAYAVMNLGAFGVALLIERDDGRGSALDDFNGLSRRNPVLAAAMAILMFSLAGAPPTAGFLAKYFVFYAAIIGGQLPLAIIGILASVLGMFYYLRVIWAMYFVEPEERVEAAEPAQEPSLVAVGAGAGASDDAVSGASAAVSTAEKTAAPAMRIHVPVGSAIALVISVALTLLMILIASPLDSFAQSVVSSLFH